MFNPQVAQRRTEERSPSGIARQTLSDAIGARMDPWRASLGPQSPMQDGGWGYGNPMDPTSKKDAMMDQAAGATLDPYWFQQRQNQSWQDDPQLEKERGQLSHLVGSYGDGIIDNRLKAAATGNDATMQSMFQRGQGQNMITDKSAQAYMQQAGQNVANQSAMAQRGGYNPAMMAASMRSTAGMGSQMAAQLSAQRLAEQQQAQQAYLTARSNAQGRYLDAQGQRLQNYGNLYDRSAQGYGMRQEFGGMASERATGAIAGNPKTAGIARPAEFG